MLKHIQILLLLFFILARASVALAQVDVLIVSDSGGHESTAAGVEQVLDQQGLSYLRINNRIFKLPLQTTFWDRVALFDQSPQTLNSQHDAWNAKTSQAQKLLEVDNSVFLKGWGQKRLISLLEFARPKMVIFVTPWGVGSFVNLQQQGYVENLPLAYVPTDYGTNKFYTKLIPSEIDMTFPPSHRFLEAALAEGNTRRSIN